MEGEPCHSPGVCWTCRKEFDHGYRSLYRVQAEQIVGPYLLCDDCHVKEKTRGLIVLRNRFPRDEVLLGPNGYSIVSHQGIRCDTCSVPDPKNRLRYSYQIGTICCSLSYELCDTCAQSRSLPNQNRRRFGAIDSAPISTVHPVSYVAPSDSSMSGATEFCIGHTRLN